jgi:hypothetical protein
MNPDTPDETLRAREAQLATASQAEKEAIIAAWEAEDRAMSEEDFERLMRGQEPMADLL